MKGGGAGEKGVIWQLQQLGKCSPWLHIWRCVTWIGDQHPATSLLDRVLRDDTLSLRYVSLIFYSSAVLIHQMLHISVYFKYGNLDPNPQSVGLHERSTYHNGTITCGGLLNEQLGSQIKENVFIAGNFRIAFDLLCCSLWTVSASEGLRKDLRDAVKAQAQDTVKYVELEFQPSKKRRNFWSWCWIQKPKITCYGRHIEWPFSREVIIGIVKIETSCFSRTRISIEAELD